VNQHHEYYLSLGSNIDPEKNLVKALDLLRADVSILAISSAWETLPVGTTGSNFFNLALEVKTPHDITYLKEQIITRIEVLLHRRRTDDKNAPRTIDIDILIYDGIVLDDHIWSQAYLALPLAELLPDLRHLQIGLPLSSIAAQLSAIQKAIHRPDVQSRIFY
jgi:2-amino-4-hydroxy-6-hydroxymethyldihydropteridine diphosphokinase